MGSRSDQRTPVLLTLWVLLVAPVHAQDVPGDPAENAARLEFFEQRIRPVLVERCYECHNSHATTKAGLALDHREALRRGGDSGPAIVPGSGRESLLVRALQHTDADLRMPEDGPKLADAVIADFVKWIDEGAVDPRDRAPSAAELRDTLSWDAVRERRKHWWSLQPLANPPIPAASGESSIHPVDRFVDARLREHGLAAAPRADRRTLIRRLTFALIGLPPTPAEIDAFVADRTADAYVALVDRLLASPHFGERWARHWMDWVRYAESHGSEGDPAIPFAWRYRDYLIRALNDDVPYDRLVREHIAGDQLPDPRIDPVSATDESRLGIAHYRFVQHGFAPTDALEEQVRFTDNQIDVLSKAFLGLTVSCARCHDHKFDAIGQRDFYALYGILASNRPATVTLDTAARQATNRPELVARKAEIKRALAERWSRAAARLPDRLGQNARPDDARVVAALERAAQNDRDPLHAWSRLRAADPEAFAATWNALVQSWQRSRAALAARRDRAQAGWDLADPDDSRQWFAHGTGLAQRPTPAGGFSIVAQGERIVTDILPAGLSTHALSTKHNGVLGSPRFAFDMQAIYVRVAGDGGAKVRYAVQNYPREGTVYPIHTLQRGTQHWVRWDTEYWRGDRGYLEITTAADAPVVGAPRAERSWFWIGEAVFVSTDQVARGEVPRDEAAEFVTPLFTAAQGKAPTTLAELGERYAQALRTCVRAWHDDTMDDAQARFLGAFVRAELLPATLRELPDLAATVAAYRRLEAAVPVPIRAPGVLEAEPFDQPFFARGDHRASGPPVPRGFLAALADRPEPAAGTASRSYSRSGSGRRQLAEDFVDVTHNPLAPRVAVNRIWHHLFGRGLVATTDNLGRLGDLPSHPDLLDHLAHHFVEDGWSIKRMIRRLVTSEAFRRDNRAPADAAQRDPTGRLLAHFPLRRLEAEAIRDALLAVSGSLDRTMYGPSVAGDSRRRSVYVRVIRNDLDPLLRTFDAPEPHTTRGRRDTTNVPAQALALLNDPFVRARATAWAETVAADATLDTDRRRIQAMFSTALGREPTGAQTSESERFLAELCRRDALLERSVADLDAQLVETRAQLVARIEPVRERLLAAAGVQDEARDLAPISAWEFDGDLEDSLGGLHGTAHGDAHSEDGALVLDGRSHVTTAPLPRELRAKTLEAWILLDDVEQRGGGVIGVEKLGGDVFDTIVFGEKKPGHWLPGSDFHRRSRDPGGAAQAPTTEGRAVHVAVSYAADGTIASYRNGQPYGAPYRSQGPVVFAAGEAAVLFGLRHSPAGGNRWLRGRITRARLYDRALQAEEIAASARGETRFVSRARVLAAMTSEQRAACDRLQRRLEALSEQRAEIAEPAGYRSQPQRLWRDYGQSLFLLEEFLSGR